MTVPEDEYEDAEVIYEHGDDLCDFVDSDCEVAWEPGPVGDEI